MNNSIRNVKWAALCAVLMATCQGWTVKAQGSKGSVNDSNELVRVSGELKQWHKVTLTMDGPFAAESDSGPNPFTDMRFAVRFRHESGSPDYVVPGYFAADGLGADSSVDSGDQWRAHLAPDKVGVWEYTTIFEKGKNVAVGLNSSPSRLRYHGLRGRFEVAPSDKSGRDFRAKGRLEYVGERYLKFAGSGEYFLKAGPDAPESLLAYADFDGTEPGRKRSARQGEAAPTQSLKTWGPHLKDWNDGDPYWGEAKGKGLIGALNYLAEKGMNTFSFLPYNAGGDGDNVWPFISRGDKVHYDVSKLAQWAVVFEHGTRNGLHLHFKLQENEIDDNRRGHQKNESTVAEALDGGKLGVERRLYLREMVARFGHNLALNWNLGEENTQSTEEIVEMAAYLREVDPYDHHIVIHTFPGQQDAVYRPLLGSKSALTGASLQNPWNRTHQRSLQWIRESDDAGKSWVVANDEQNPANQGVPPDAGYAGHSGEATLNGQVYTADDIRKYTLWGNLMAGGAGVEYYFGYQLPQNDLVCEDWRSRDQSWDYCRVALDFFHEREVPFWDMENHNQLIGNDDDDNSKYCLAHVGSVYVVYLPEGGQTELDLSESEGEFEVVWFDPRTGGDPRFGSVRNVQAGGVVDLGAAPMRPQDDWVILVRRSTP